MDQEVKEVFTPKPMVSFRNVSKPSSYLVRAKLYPLVHLNVKVKGVRHV